MVGYRIRQKRRWRRRRDPRTEEYSRAREGLDGIVIDVGTSDRRAIGRREAPTRKLTSALRFGLRSKRDFRSMTSDRQRCCVSTLMIGKPFVAGKNIGAPLLL